jgi:hypothetical protein
MNSPEAIALFGKGQATDHPARFFDRKNAEDGPIYLA